jgi:hypothetical protein
VKVEAETGVNAAASQEHQGLPKVRRGKEASCNGSCGGTMALEIPLMLNVQPSEEIGRIQGGMAIDIV